MLLPYAVKNGHLILAENAWVSAADLAVCRGYGIFDYFDVQAGVPLFLSFYLERFERSAKGLNLKLSWSREELARMVRDLINANQIPKCGIRLLLTGGFSESSYEIQSPELLILAYQAPIYDEVLYTQGVKLMTTHYMRTFPHIKSIQYLHGLYMQHQLRAEGFDYLLYHYQGAVLESDRSNFFMIDEDDAIVTAEHNVLHGITRKIILEIAADLNLKVVLESPTLEQLRKCKSAWISNTTAKMLPVSQIDDYILPECPSSVFDQLWRGFQDRIAIEIQT